jgi:Uma2 family endonuclease
MVAPSTADIDALLAVDGKAELVGGQVVVMPPAGFLPSQAALVIASSLLEHARRTGAGFAFADGAGFRVDLPHRQSFSPDAAFYTGLPTGMRFLEGAPIFAVEVRSEGDRPEGARPAAEEALRRKRDDYFAAGTQVVWDVDLLSEDVIRAYHASDPQHPRLYRRGELADAEPAVPGWRLAVDDLLGLL